MPSLLTEAWTWFEHHIGFTLGLFVAWIVTLLVTAWVVHRFLISIPPDYYARPHEPLEAWRNSHPVLRWSLLIGKNVLGIALAAAGVIMLFTPGQGVLTLLLGIALLDLPGKRAVERRIAQRPTVAKLLNLIRAKANRPPLVFAEEAS